MTIPSPTSVRAARNASTQMADRCTPFVYQEWYVAAFSDELNRSLLKRTLLDKQIVMFRLEDGTPIALADRCAHRSYPLSAGTLKGDSIVCGYHGFRYDADGNCVEVPSAIKCPRSIGVRKYPLFEAGDLVWIWMGDPAAATPATVHGQDWIYLAEWTRSKGYFHLNGNYVSLHENLLDLTHLSFLHSNSFGTPDYARAPFTVDLADGQIKLRRDVVPTTLPPVWAKPTGLGGVKTAARIATSEFISPAFHQVTVSFYDSKLPESARPVFTIRTAHLPTPETHESTHYFIVHGRDFAQDDPNVTQFMHDQLFAAFKEDVDGMELLEQTLLHTSAADFYEMSVASDAPAVEMRRRLKRRADDEGELLPVPRTAS